MNRRLYLTCGVLAASVIVSACELADDDDDFMFEEPANIVNVTVTSTGQQRVFYLIPDEIWRRSGGHAWLDEGLGLERYEGGRTPKEDLVRRAGIYVVAWRCSGEWMTDRLTASPMGSNSLEIECDPRN